MARIINIINKRFGKFLVISRVESNTSPQAMWECLCDCGNTKVVLSSPLRNGLVTSCGCHRATKPAVSNLSEYGIWNGMKSRCTNSNEICYPQYGGRGISICSRWMDSFHNFYADMGPRPSMKHTLDRINNDGNYEPGNVRWATWKEQNNNKRPRSLSSIKRDHGYRLDELEDRIKTLETIQRKLLDKLFEAE